MAADPAYTSSHEQGRSLGRGPPRMGLQRGYSAQEPAGCLMHQRPADDHGAWVGLQAWDEGQFGTLATPSDCHGSTGRAEFGSGLGNHATVVRPGWMW